jgi:hypothetical protein
MILSLFYPQSPHLFRNYVRGDYVLLYNLSSDDWSCVYNQSSTDFAGDQLKTVVTEALKLAISYKCSRKSKFPYWFSSAL